MNTRSLPDYTTVTVSLTAWMSALAILAWASLGATVTLGSLVAPVLLTALAVGSAALIFWGGEQPQEEMEEVQAKLVLKDAPAARN